jgi:hypothetical protein
MRVRPQEWLDRWLQFVGYDPRGREMVPVAIWQDGRGISSREAAPYQTFSVSAGNPGAGNHWCYTLTPANASKPLTVRICWLKARLETVTANVGVRIGTATAKAATNAVFPIGDSNAQLGGTWTVDEITNANLPLILFNLFTTVTLGPADFAPMLGYPNYWLEAVIPQGQVLEIINATQDDAFSLALGHYSLPIV